MKKFSAIKFGLLALLATAGSFLLYKLGGHEAVTGGAAMAALPVMVIPKNSKDIPAIQGFLDSIRQQFASTAQVYEGPIRELFNEVTAKLEAALALLPKTTDCNWSLDEKLEQFFSLIAAANNVVSSLNLEIGKLKQEHAAALAAKPAEVEALVTAQIAERTGEKGDLTTKELTQQLCSAAKLAGITEGIAQRNTELAAEAAKVAVVAERKTALTTASLPLPEGALEAVLQGTPEQFEAAKTTAADRLKKFTTAGVNLPPALLGKIWLPDGAEYQTFESTAMGCLPALQHKPAPKLDEPLAGPVGSAASGKKILL